MSRIYVAVDLETTGLDADRDAIIEIGAVKFRVSADPTADPVLDRWTTLVDPRQPLPFRVSRLTGITESDLDHAPPLSRVLDEFRAFVGNYPVIGHNVAFELAFLQRHGVLMGQAHLDTFELSSLLLPFAPRYSLGQLADFLDISFDGWHRALADAEMAMHLFLALWREACALPRATLQAIVEVAMDSRWPLRSFWAAALRSGPPPTPPEPRPPRESPPAPGAPLQRVDDPPPLPREAMLALLDPGGDVARAIPRYEARPEQRAVLDAIVQALDAPDHLIVEAGAGTGKTLAYAIAAVYEATRRGETVVISTNTLNLQDQLVHDELPRLARGLDRVFTAQCLKGQTNYVCPRRVAMLQQRGGFSPAEARLLARVLVWLGRTTTGDRAELNIQRDEETTWELLCADAESCRADRCAPYGTCHWLQARALAAHAHLLIVNHALLLSDLATDGGHVPPYRTLIVDEAHHLEAQATQQFGYALRRDALDARLNRLSQETRGRATGLLDQIRGDARTSRGRDLSSLVEACGRLERHVAYCRDSAEEVYACLEEIVAELPRHSIRHRILAEWRARAEWRRLARRVERFADDVAALRAGLSDLEPRLVALGLGDALWMDRADECRRLNAEFHTIAEEMTRILVRPDANDVSWLMVRETDDPDADDEEEGASFQITLHRSPVLVAPLLRERLFAAKRSVILTSATLGSDGSFGYLRDRLGLDRAEELSVGSPYDFARQALVYVAEDLPQPNQPAYGEALHHALVDLARATQGRMLVLFTSKSQLRRAYRAISSPLARYDIVVLAQYLDGSRTTLIERLRTVERTVLLGTLSFWEGVDVPGDALSCLVITRLPFPVPSDPIHAARAEGYRNAFLDYMVPQAVIRFRQGVGRLLRTAEDRGVVALLDSRIEHKQYGSTFINALPPATLHIGSFRELPPLAERWLRGNGRG